MPLPAPSNYSSEAVKTAPPAKPKRSWQRRAGRAVVLYAVVPYLVIFAMLALLQRYLIYHPFRTAEITTADARLPDGKVATVSVTTNDGLELRGWHFAADGAPATDARGAGDELPGKGLLILYFSGNAGNRIIRADDCLDFTALGAEVLLVDYRGYGENPGSPSEEGLARDARAIWRYATQERGIPAERIVLFGESLGGGVATRLCAESCQRGERPAGLILTATFSSLVDAAGWHYPYFPVRLAMLDRYPSVERATHVTCPVLQLHGTADDIVPFALGRKLFAAFPETSANDVAKQFVELRHAGHNDIPRGEFQQAVMAFFTTLPGVDGATRRK